MWVMTFNHEAVYERLPSGHVERLFYRWGLHRRLEKWAEREKISVEVLAAVDRFVAPYRVGVN